MKQSKSVFNPLDYPSILADPSRLTNIASWHEHIPFAFWIVATLRPKTLVELGTHKGDSYSAFCQAVAQLGLATSCYAVDTWKGDEHAGFYEEDVFTELKTYHDQQYGKFSKLIKSTFDEALKHFSDGSIDLLHIDGLHTYDAVRHDLDCWLPKMSKGGAVLLHDTNVHEKGFGVWKLWEELKEQYSSFEFTHGHGLGLLITGNVAPERLNTLLAARKEVKENARRLFYLLGNRVALQRSNDQLQQAIAERDRQVANLNQTVVERDGRIAALNQAVTHREGQITSLNQAAAEREAQIASQSSDLAAYQRQAEQFDKQLKATQEELRAAYAQIASQSSDLAAYQRQAEQFDKQLKATQEELRAAYAQIASQSSDLAAYQRQAEQFDKQLKATQEELRAAYAQIASQSSDLAAYQRQAEQFDQDLRDTQYRLAGLSHENAKLQAQLQDLTQLRQAELRNPRFLARQCLRELFRRLRLRA